MATLYNGKRIGAMLNQIISQRGSKPKELMIQESRAIGELIVQEFHQGADQAAYLCDGFWAELNLS